ncbi:MAG: deoxynucleoside kinase [Calditrichaeota bacterium]|nr:MAG: deoxynucleoside kinase [Calditrichota bacterium]
MSFPRPEKSANIPFFLAIAGNIGVGKTTLTTLLAEKLQLKPFFERVINNPYLDDFYRDMNRWSFNLQVYFLSQRFIDQSAISASKVPCIQDRSIYEDAEIFAYILHKQGFMSDRDYENYCDLFRIMTDYLRKPDLILYLKASTWTLITRIRKRGREFEKKITIDYLHELNEAYDRWIKSIESTIPVMTVDADNVDFERNPEQMQDIYNQLAIYLGKEVSGWNIRKPNQDSSR